MATVEAIQDSLAANPALANSPSLVLASANTSDPSGTAELLGAASQYSGASSALRQFQQQQGSGMYAGLVNNLSKGPSPLLHDASQALNVLNAPLNEVQHNYRYIRDVYHRHGWFSGLLETLGMAAGAAVGAVAGTFVGAPVAGAVLGAEGAGALEGQAFYHDSWKATANPNYMINGHLVSPGRDLAGLLGFHHDAKGGYAGLGSLVSGITDAGFDWYTDPLMKTGNLATVLRRSDKGLRGIIAAKWDLKSEQQIADSGNRVAQFMYKLAPGRGLDTNYPDQIVLADQRYGTVRRAVDWITDQNAANVHKTSPEQVQQAKGLIDSQLATWDPDTPDWVTATARARLEKLQPAKLVAMGRIINAHPELAPMAEALAETTTREGTLDVFRRAVANKELIGRMNFGTLPSRSLMRVGVQKVTEAIASPDLTREGESQGLTSINPLAQVQARASRKLRTFAGFAPFTMSKDDQALAYEFDPKDPNAAKGILNSLKFGMGYHQAQVWTAVMTHAATTGDTALAKKIWAEGSIENLKAMGLPDDQAILDYITKKTRHVTYGEGTSEQYGVGYYGGDSVSKVKTEGGTQDLGLYNYQRGQLAFPDFMRAKRVMRSMQWYTRPFGWLDDFAAEHYLQPFFKPLALVTMGFGTRVALNEALISASQYGSINHLRAMVTSTVAKHNYPKMVDGFKDASYDESLQLIKASAQTLGGWSKFLGADPQRLERAFRLVYENDGHIVKGLPAAGHSGLMTPDDPEGQYSQELHFGVQQDRGRFSFMHNGSLVPSGNYTILPFDHANFRDLYWGALARRSREKSAQIIAHDLMVGMAKDNAQVDLARGKDFFERSNAPALPAGTTDVSAGSEVAGGTTPRVVTPTEIIPARPQVGPAPGPAVAANDPEAQIKRAFDYAASRERKRIAGLDPDTDRAFANGLDPYANERGTIARYVAQGPHEFAADRVDDVLNLLTGRDGTFHSNLAEKLRKGEPFTHGDVRKIDPTSLPRKVAGQEMQPWVGPGMFQSAVQGAYKRLVDPVVNWLSRQPTYFNAVDKHYNALLGAVDKGIIDDRDAFRFAQYRAANEMLPMIHNTALRSQFGLMVRNFMPFYFAQEQAMKRAGRAILKAPDVVRRWMLIENALHDPGFVHTDQSTGQRYLVFPGIGSMASDAMKGLSHLGIPLVSGLPFTATGDLQSMQTVLPEVRMPSFSPMVSLPLNWMTSFDPLLAPLTKGVLGDRGFHENILQAVIPSAAIRDAIIATGVLGNYQSLSNAQLSAVASAYFHNKLPSPSEYEANPFKAQQKIDEVRNNARSNFVVKAILSLFSPLSANVTTDLGIQQEYYALLKKYQNVPGAAQDAFIQEHGDKSIGFTLSKSHNVAGAYIPYTNSVQNFLDQNRSALQQHPLAMSYLVPQSGTSGDVQVIHDELMRLAVKQADTPQQFLESIYQSQGERIWRASQQAYYTTKGTVSNPPLTQAYTDWVNQFRLWNPVAYNYIKSPDRDTRSLYIYQDLQNVYAKGIAPNTPEAANVQALLQQFDAHWQQVAPLVESHATSAASKLSDDYHAYLVQLAKDRPDLDSVIYNVFLRLDTALQGKG